MARSSVLLLALLSLFLAGCPKGGAITCPTLKQYDKAFMSAVADELDLIEAKAPHVVKMIDDYGVERDAIRKCIELRKKAK